MKINKFTNDIRNADLHTNGFAEAAGGTFAQTSTESFSQRYQRDRQRRVVGGYRQSLVGSGQQGREKPLKLTVPPRETNAQASEVDERQAQPSHSYTEPTARSYNPYS